MPKTKFKQIENLHRVQRTTLALVLFLFLSLVSKAQNVPADFVEKAEAIIQLQPKTYESLDEHLDADKSDTLLLRYFAQLSKENNYPEGQAYALNQLGSKYRNISQYKKAADLHEQALAASEEANNTELRVLSLNMLGVVYRRTDAIKTALDYNQKALELAETVENPSNHIKRKKG